MNDEEFWNIVNNSSTISGWQEAWEYALQNGINVTEYWDSKKIKTGYPVKSYDGYDVSAYDHGHKPTGKELALEQLLTEILLGTRGKWRNGKESFKPIPHNQRGTTKVSSNLTEDEIQEAKDLADGHNKRKAIWRQQRKGHN